MFYQLPPAGNPVVLSGPSDTSLADLLLSPYHALYASGTAALSSAVAAAVAARGIDAAEVILPAYGCPDLVSAVVYAGAKPVLVDLESERPWLDTSALAKSVNDRTVAIVAVNLFGISERWDSLAAYASQKGLVLIEDSAQYFPGAEEAQNWHGDLTVLSFGRGKPVSLLGGGAVLGRDKDLVGLLPATGPVGAGMQQRLSFTLKARLYNLLLSPYIYWLPLSLPFLHLGETRYHALHVIEAMDDVRKALLAVNIHRYQHDTEAVRRCEKLSDMLGSVPGVVDLPRACGMPLNRRLLRYPVLVDAGRRDELLLRLQRNGLGVSTMYPAQMPALEGLEAFFDVTSSYVNASQFAARLITLPTHEKLTDDKIRAIKDLLSAD